MCKENGVCKCKKEWKKDGDSHGDVSNEDKKQIANQKHSCCKNNPAFKGDV